MGVTWSSVATSNLKFYQWAFHILLWWSPMMCTTCWWFAPVSYTVYQILTHFITQYLKSTFANIIPLLISSERSSVLGSFQALKSGQKFSHILMSTQKFKFYHWQHMLSVVCLEVIGSCLFFSSNLPNTQPWITMICPLAALSRESGVRWAIASSAHASYNRPSAFHQDGHHHSFGGGTLCDFPFCHMRY